jgi:sortase B
MPQMEFRRHSSYNRRRKHKPSLFPKKGDSRSEATRKVVFLVSAVTLIVTTVILLDYYVFNVFGFFMKEVEPTNPDVFTVNRENTATGTITIPVDPSDSGVSSNGVVQVTILERYRELYELNNEFVGYISLGEHINYPVALRKYDNDFYLSHNFERRYDFIGTIFADGWSRFTYPDPPSGRSGRPQNIVLHGHYGRPGAVFHPLREYTRNDRGLAFLQDNPIVHFDTLFEEGTYKIFAVAQINVEESLGDVFNFWQRSHFETNDDFLEYIVEVLDRSQLHNDVDIRFGDELLTLSTCDQTMFNPGLRIVIVARRVRPDECVLPAVCNCEIACTGMNPGEFVDLTARNARGQRGRNDQGFMRYMMFHDFYKIMNNNRGWVGRSWREWDINRVEGLRDFLIRNPQFLDM